MRDSISDNVKKDYNYTIIIFVKNNKKENVWYKKRIKVFKYF